MIRFYLNLAHALPHQHVFPECSGLLEYLYVQCCTLLSDVRALGQCAKGQKYLHIMITQLR